MKKSAFRVVPCVAAVIALLVSASASPVSAAKARVVRVTMTNSWRVPAPDPRGLAYNQHSHRLYISDSEIDETNRWRGRNLFTTSRRGRLLRVGSLRKATVEPEDSAWDNQHRALYVVDDNRDRVFRFRSGRDHVLGTNDDHVDTVLRTRQFGSSDPEGLGISVRFNMLIVADARGDRVFKVRRGPDKRVGTADDVVSSFSTRRIGFEFPTDVTWDKKSGHLFTVGPVENVILETTMKGRLVRKIGLTGTTIRSASGIVFGQGSNGRPHHLYIVDAGIDDGLHPNQNDGRLFELRIRRAR
jgi:hypothetical protein